MLPIQKVHIIILCSVNIFNIQFVQMILVQVFTVIFAENPLNSVVIYASLGTNALILTPDFPSPIFFSFSFCCFCLLLLYLLLLLLLLLLLSFCFVAFSGILFSVTFDNGGKLLSCLS